MAMAHQGWHKIAIARFAYKIREGNFLFYKKKHINRKS